MKQLIILLIISLFSLSQAIEVVELPLPNTNKVVVKLMFKNGSITDPAGKEGLTFLTANLITQGGTDKMSYSEIQEFIYPMAVNYFVSVDKEVTTFTFEVHKDFLEKFYPVMTALILEPSFTTADFERVKINQQNYVDQVI
ncbi:MAG: insulinase family protein, partial [Calditrichia bacterium]|nr:insulinase family protein [Calditrichia bacterium]